MRLAIVFLVSISTIFGSNIVSFAKCMERLTLPQVLKVAKEKLIPYELDEDTQDDLEMVILARYLGERYIPSNEDLEVKQFAKAVFSRSCSELSGPAVDICLGLVRFNQTRFISGMTREEQEVGREKDWKLLYYIYVFYANPNRLKKLARKDILAAYVYLFLSDPDCACISEKRVERWFSIMQSFLGTRKIPGKMQDFPEVLKYLLRNIDSKDYSKFRDDYF